MTNFLTRMVEALGNSALKSMLPEMYFLTEGENPAESPGEEAQMQVEEQATE